MRLIEVRKLAVLLRTAWTFANSHGGPMRLIALRVLVVFALIGLYMLNAAAGIAVLVAGTAYATYHHLRPTRVATSARS